MTAIATLPVLLGTGIHSARPAASDVGSGALYSCTTHGLIYQMTAGSWGTWLTLASGMSDPMTTRGDIIVRDASNVTARLPIGSTGKVLSSDGTDISWQTPAGGSGALILLEQHTASSSATLDFTTAITSTYDDYVIHIVNAIPATNNVTLGLRMSTDGGSTYDAGASAYTYSTWRFHSGSGTAVNGAAATSILCAGADGLSSTTNRGGVSGTLSLFNPLSTAVYKLVQGEVSHGDQTNAVLEHASIVGWYPSTTAVNAIRFIMSSGNIASGTIRVYGVAK